MFNLAIKMFSFRNEHSLAGNKDTSRKKNIQVLCNEKKKVAAIG